MSKRLDAAIDEWLLDYKKNSVKVATYSRLRCSYETMLRYPVATKQIDELKTIDIQRYANQLAESGYALSTIKKELHLLTAFLRHAYAEGEIGTPVYLGVKPPTETSIRTPAKNIESYSQTEQRKLLKVLNTMEDRLYGAPILMLETGLRVGETLALTWKDIDWDRRAVRVSKTLVRVGGDQKAFFVQPSPKSKTSNRIVPLSARAMELLEQLRESSRRAGYIFYDQRDESKPSTYDQLRSRLKTACDRAEVPYKGNHVFRHTFATNCYNRGCNVKILSKLLGHADVAITYNTYIHLFGDALEEMRAVIG